MWFMLETPSNTCTCVTAGASVEFDVYQAQNLLRRLGVPKRRIVAIVIRELTLAKILKRFYSWVVSVEGVKDDSTSDNYHRVTRKSKAIAHHRDPE
jgi:hypothetical protein